MGLAHPFQLAGDKLFGPVPGDADKHIVAVAPVVRGARALQPGFANHGCLYAQRTVERIQKPLCDRGWSRVAFKRVQCDQLSVACLRTINSGMCRGEGEIAAVRHRPTPC